MNECGCIISSSSDIDVCDDNRSCRRAAESPGAFPFAWDSTLCEGMGCLRGEHPSIDEAYRLTIPTGDLISLNNYLKVSIDTSIVRLLDGLTEEAVAAKLSAGIQPRFDHGLT